MHDNISSARTVLVNKDRPFETSKTRWEKSLARFPESNFLQSWNWGEFHQKLGHPIYRVIEDDFQFQAIVEPARRARYLTVPGGPLLKDWLDEKTQLIVTSKLREIAARENCCFIRIRPQVLDAPTSHQPLATNHYLLAPMHLHAQLTRILDLTKSDDQLLSEMRKSTRYEIRKAEKLSMTAEQSNSEELIQELYNLEVITAKRHHFIPFSRKYLLEQFRTFNADNQAKIFFVKQNDHILCISLIIFYHTEAVYHYAASSDDSRNTPAAYAMQWAIIQEAKKRKCTTYNLWGDVPDDKLSTHRFAGPSIFKRGFGGTQLSYLPAHDLPLSWKYWPSWLIETMRKKTRGL